MLAWGLYSSRNNLIIGQNSGVASFSSFGLAFAAAERGDPIVIS